MSDDVKRFDPVIDCDSLASMEQYREGQYVEYTDYYLLAEQEKMVREETDRYVRLFQRANNEVHGLNSQVAALIDHQKILQTEVADLKSTADRFKAEVERLRKQLDLMIAWHIHEGFERSIIDEALDKIK